MQWRAIHVYYHDENTDGLVLHGVRPLFERLEPHVPEAYFAPHWRLGPHLRLNFRTDEATFTDLVWPAVQEMIGSYLREHPSTTVLDPEEILPLHQRLAELEHEREPLWPWRENNTIVAEPYDKRPHVLGNTETAELLARFYVATSPMTFAILAAAPEHRERVRIAFALMLATVQAFSVDGLARDYVTFRSHAEAFLRNADGGEQRRDAWDKQFQHNAAHFASELTEVLATVDGKRNSVPFIRDWIDTLQPIRSQAEDMLSAGTLSMPSAAGGDFASLSSRFHRALVSNPAAMQRMQADWFTIFRLLMNYTYLQLTRIRVSPLERNALCHLAANTAERYFGTNAVELVGGERS